MNVTDYSEFIKVSINIRGLIINLTLHTNFMYFRALTTWFENYRNPEFIRKYNNTKPTKICSYCLSIDESQPMFSTSDQGMCLVGETLDEFVHLLLPELKKHQEEYITLDESYKVVIDHMGDIADLYIYNEHYSYEFGEINWHDFEYFWSYRYRFYTSMQDIHKIGDKIIIKRDGKTYNIPISLFEKILA